MKKYYFLVAFTFYLIYSSYAFAQHPSAQRDYVDNHLLWLTMQLNGKIAGKFNYGLDLEMRRQADPAHGYDFSDTIGNSQYNIFAHPLQQAIRPWIHYQPNTKIRFSWAPITWFGTWSFPVNGKTSYQPEFRTSPQITYYTSYGRVQITNRCRYEFRFMGTRTITNNLSDPTGPDESYSFPKTGHQGRFRYMLRLLTPLNKAKVEKGTYYLLTSTEILLNLGKNIPNYRLLDQYRFNIAFGYKFHQAMRFEIGYISQTAFRMNNKAKNNVDVNNILSLSFVFDDLNSLFKKKKTDE